MKKNLSSFSHMFEADTGMDRRDPLVSAWSDALVHKNSHRDRKFIATDVDNWLDTMMKEASSADKSATVDISFDEINDLFCVTMTDASGCSSFCVPPPRNPKSSKEKLILDVINGGPEAHEAFRKTVMKFKGDSPAVTESDKTEEAVFSAEDIDDLSDDDIDEISSKLDKAASLVANNQAAAYMIELAASRIRELKDG